MKTGAKFIEQFHLVVNTSDPKSIQSLVRYMKAEDAHVKLLRNQVQSMHLKGILSVKREWADQVGVEVPP